VYMYALAYGLVGGGGNAPFIGGFHFASLFDAQGVRCAVLAAGFNIAGYFYLLLNIGPLSLEAFFYGAATFTVLLGIGISRVYPDTPYRRGDVAVLSPWPSCGRTRTCTPCQDIVSALRRATPALRMARYWGFCFTFGWGALVGQWSSGAVGSALFFPNAPDAYFTWGDPLITNATFLVTPLLGAIIDRFGFRLPGLLTLASAIGLVVALWNGEDAMQWPVLLLICLLNATVYTLQFAYLTMAFPSDLYSGLLTVTVAVQCSLGFIAWPLLAVVKPFGADPSLGNFLLMLVPSVLCGVWPLWLQWVDDRRLVEAGVVGIDRVAKRSQSGGCATDLAAEPPRVADAIAGATPIMRTIDVQPSSGDSGSPGALREGGGVVAGNELAQQCSNAEERGVSALLRGAKASGSDTVS